MALRLGRDDGIPPLRRELPRALLFSLSPIRTMRLFYLDESGNPEMTGPSSCYVLTAVGIPISRWTACDKAINQLKRSYNMPDAEIHTGWMLRRYREQEEIADFAQLSYAERRAQVIANREQVIEKAKTKNPAAIKQWKKTFRNTDAYIHLTLHERERFIGDLARLIASWKDVRLFAEIIDKRNYSPPSPGLNPATQAFERVVTRIEKYLSHISGTERGEKRYGLLIHDQCEAQVCTHTTNMNRYHRFGTFSTRTVSHIIETPLFVDSARTGMVQVADLCAYAMRRKYEENDTTLFDIIKKKADKIGDFQVGLNHYTSSPCSCELCRNKRKQA